MAEPLRLRPGNSSRDRDISQAPAVRICNGRKGEDVRDFIFLPETPIQGPHFFVGGEEHAYTSAQPDFILGAFDKTLQTGINAPSKPAMDRDFHSAHKNKGGL